VNPFDWNAGFPEAMKAGGFDCVIGNPPYVRQESLGLMPEPRIFIHISSKKHISFLSKAAYSA